MFKYVIQTLNKRLTRTILTIVAIAVCIQMYSVITSIITYTVKDLHNEVDTYAEKMYIKTKTAMSSSGETFPPFDSGMGIEEGNEILSALDEYVDSNRSTPILFNMIANATYPNGAPQAMAVGIELGKEEVYIGNAKLKAGSNHLEAHKKGVILGYSAAKFYKVNQIGEEIDILGTKFTVIGLLDKETRVEDPVVLMTIQDCQELFSLTDTYSALLVTQKSSNAVQEIKHYIDNNYERLKAIDYEDINKNMVISLQGTKMFMGVIKYTVLIVSIVIILIVMTMAVLERTREMGILRAIGAQKRTVMGAIIMEATIISSIGGLLGIGLGYIMMRFLMQGEGFFTFAIGIESVCIAILLGVLSSIIPALKANNIQPQEALRYE